YELARDNKEVALKECDITVFDAKLLLYSHPFVTFEVKVSKGTYVRTLGEIVANELECNGALSYLERICEGDFCFDGEKEIPIKSVLAMPQNQYKKDKTDIILGKKLDVQEFELQDDGIYFVDNGDMLSIIEIKEQKVHYKLNNIEI
ncbi:MAG TPA: tRNA pseudouridine(55) synthase TruB, partial [Campylobacterales bacterium]|nr:tRNA pseudouridine(55) synthase TruB [Campylobacterales bacterium]